MLVDDLHLTNKQRSAMNAHAAAIVLARQSAQREVTRRIKREGRIKLSSLTAARIARLANEYLEAHPELIAEAAVSPIVQNLANSFKRRRAAPQGLLVCECHGQNRERK
jgi:hypothetical protein